MERSDLILPGKRKESEEIVGMHQHNSPGTREKEESQRWKRTLLVLRDLSGKTCGRGGRNSVKKNVIKI